MEMDTAEVERYETLVIASEKPAKHPTWTFAQTGHSTARGGTQGAKPMQVSGNVSADEEHR
jgi:hypothetical protein